MNRPPFLLLLILAGSSLTGVSAQDIADLPPPRFPLVATVPEDAAWILSVIDSKESAQQLNQTKKTPLPDADPLKLKEIQVTKTGALKRDLTSFGSGNPIETWYADGMLIAPDIAGQPKVTDYRAIEKRFGSGLNATESAGFTGLCWLDLKYYEQVVLYQGQPCYHYRLKPSPGVSSNLEAWINAKTKLPVAYTTDDGRLCTYRFLDAPTTPLTLPPAYQAALTKYEKELDKINRLNEASAALRRP